MDRLFKYQRVFLALLFIVIGAGLTATLVGAIMGLPLILIGIWMMLQKSTLNDS